MLEEAGPSLVYFQGAGLKQTALHWAATKGQDACLSWLLQQGAPVHAANANGATRNPPLTISPSPLPAAGRLDLAPISPCA